MSGPLDAGPLERLSGTVGGRGGAVLALFAVLASSTPGLEEMSWEALQVLTAVFVAVPLLGLGGGVWALEARNAEAGRARLQELVSWAAWLVAAAYALLVLEWERWGRPELQGAAFVWGLLALLTASESAWRFVAEGLAESPRRLRPLSVEGAAAVAPSAAPNDVAEPLLVSSGSFRVDRLRALEALKAHQLPDARDFLLPWLRLAVASGASRVALDVEGTGVALRFDGRALAPERLKDPYACLFEEEGEDGARYRQLAYGLLALSRLEPRAGLIVSGASGARARFDLFAEGAASAKRLSDDAGEGTVLRVEFGAGEGRRLARDCAARAAGAYGLADAPLVVSGKPAETPQSAFEDASAFGAGTSRGFVAPGYPGEGNRVRVYVLGVAAAELEHPCSHRSFAAHLREDRLRLDASQAGLVRDGVFKEAMQAVEKEAHDRLSGARAAAAASRPQALPKPAMLGALLAALASFGLFWLSVFVTPDLAPLAGALHALLTLLLLAFCLRWAVRRLAGGSSRSGSRSGQTLFELMIPVVIIGVLAAIAVPKFRELLRRSADSATRDALRAVRRDLQSLNEATGGLYPAHPAALGVAAAYRGRLPWAQTKPYHPQSPEPVIASSTSALTDAGGWLYVGDPRSPAWGTILVNCTHTDFLGHSWSSY